MKKFAKMALTLLLCIAIVFSVAACDGTQGPRGAQGEKGEQGIQGEQGVPGINGEDGADGLSAYEIYLKYYPDYKGTEKEWIDDLAAGLLGKMHTVTFDTQGGNVIESKQVAHRNSVSLEQASKDGFIFTGWYEDPQCLTPCSSIILKDTTLYAGWVDDKNSEAFFRDYIYGTGFRGSAESKGIFDSKTPISADDVECDWATKLSPGWMSSPGFPIEVGEYIYIAVGSQLKRIDKTTGEILNSVAMKGSIGFFSSIAYGDGKIFVTLGGGIIQAFDETSMESLWITETPKDKDGNPLKSQQALSPITYHNGYIYNGITYGDASTGAFFCVSTKDEDPSTTDEIKEFTWCYVPETLGGFYWSEGVVVGDCIVFAGEAGILYTHSLTGDERNEDGSVKFIDSFVLPSSEQSGSETESVRSSLCYDETTGRVLISTKAGNIHSIKVGKDGQIDESSVKTTFVQKDITSSPIVYRGRVYVGSGGILATAGITVLDAETLEIIYENKDIHTQSSLVLSTAYATAENDYTVYIYFVSYERPDSLYVMKDWQGNQQSEITKLMDTPAGEYNSSSVLIGEDGAIYYKNDSGNLFRISTVSDNTFTAEDVENAIALLPDTLTTQLDKVALIRAKYRFNQLSESEQSKVTNVTKLNQLWEQL